MPPALLPWFRRVFFLFLGLIVLLLLVLLGMALWPLTGSDLVLRSKPVEGYEAAQAMIAKLQQAAPEGILPECQGTVLDHGHPTEEVYVLLHGLTNCPAQFREFGEMLFAAGANVLIPRTPYHGFVEEHAASQKLMDGQAILDSANQAVDLAHALGKRVTVLGLSVNGTTAAWIAQHRADVGRVVLIAPFFAPAGVPPDWVGFLPSR